MSATAPPTLRSQRREVFALLTYLTLLGVLIAFAASMIVNLLDAYAALGASREMLARLDRQSPQASSGSHGDPRIDAPPFLSGETVTVAGAALQERVETAVKRAGGSVVSSQIDLQVPRAAEGYIELSESLEIQQAGVQALLYDLEAGMPYLFVESLAIQSPQAFGESQSARMRVLIAVTGQWQESQ